MNTLEHVLPHLPGTGRIYNLMPRETDANGAAAEGIRVRYPEKLGQIERSIHASLVRQNGPEEVTTLFFRSFCFAYLFRAAVDAELQCVCSTPISRASAAAITRPTAMAGASSRVIRAFSD
jgi:hypothetical protein